MLEALHLLTVTETMHLAILSSEKCVNIMVPLKPE